MHNLTRFFVEIDQLKKTYRFSTMVPEARDSSADHSWKLMLMAIYVAEHLGLDVDIMQSVKLAGVHDLPEYITGEIDSKLIYNGNVTRESKSKLERKALEDIRKRYKKIGREVFNLCKEFEEGKTREARYIKALDKIEALTHIIHNGGELNDDWDYTATYADKAVENFPELKPLLKEVKLRLREECEKVGEIWKKEYDIF